MLRTVDFHGLKAVEFSKGDYTALLVPEMGANLVRLANTRLGAEILRTPGADEIEVFKSRPQVFGLPILFPPNRIADGRYTFEGRTYQDPITIEKEQNYHHGVLKSEAFIVSKARETAEEVMVECRYYANAGNDAVFRDFPHEFKCKITYWLSADGLEQEVMFSNRSKMRMPIGVGFHTPLCIPFAGGDAADYVMRVAVGEQVDPVGLSCENDRMLPVPFPESKRTAYRHFQPPHHETGLRSVVRQNATVDVLGDHIPHQNQVPSVLLFPRRYSSLIARWTAAFTAADPTRAPIFGPAAGSPSNGAYSSSIVRCRMVPNIGKSTSSAISCCGDNPATLRK